MPIFKNITEMRQEFKNLYGFGGTLSQHYRHMDLQPCFKVSNLVSVYLQSAKLGQMTTLYAFFHVVVSPYRLVKI